jgi:hypothetical protein|tara:strand:- start:522 stop:770 length:249 start_codon:yes stop_codon:yes gene_type:complete
MNVDPEVEKLAESLLKSGLASSIEDAIPKAEKMLNKGKIAPLVEGDSTEAAGDSENAEVRDQVSSDTPDADQTSLSEHHEEA